MFRLCIFAVAAALAGAFTPRSPLRSSLAASRTTALAMVSAPPGYKPMADGSFKKAGDFLDEYVLECDNGAKVCCRPKNVNLILYLPTFFSLHLLLCLSLPLSASLCPSVSLCLSVSLCRALSPLPAHISTPPLSSLSPRAGAIICARLEVTLLAHIQAHQPLPVASAGAPLARPQRCTSL